MQVTDRRRRQEFARCLKWLSKRYPDAITIHLVMDNLNTHTKKSLTETFGPIDGRRLWARFTIHYTPKHASWLNQAEIALSIMSRCCLGRHRVPSIPELRRRVVAFWRNRRRERWKIDWRFTKTKADLWIHTFVTEH